MEVIIRRMRMFMTGATGFIGRHIAPRLSAEGHPLVCLVRTPSRRVRLTGLGAEIVIGDVADPAAVRAGLRGCDAVVHLAGVDAAHRLHTGFYFDGPRPSASWG